jgi:hypothetical protein
MRQLSASKRKPEWFPARAVDPWWTRARSVVDVLLSFPKFSRMISPNPAPGCCRCWRECQRKTGRYLLSNHRSKPRTYANPAQTSGMPVVRPSTGTGPGRLPQKSLGSKRRFITGNTVPLQYEVRDAHCGSRDNLARRSSRTSIHHDPAALTTYCLATLTA